MNEEKFTDDNQYSELKKLLNEIPKVNAPDNFEFNLMTKIQNKNFEVKSEKKKTIFSWALTPALGFAASVFLILFLFTGNEDLDNNPWQVAPKLIESSVAETVNNVRAGLNSAKTSIAKQVNKTKTSELATQQQFPFDTRTSVSLDEGLHSEINPNSNFGSARLAGSSNDELIMFNGFFLREVKRDDRRDSLKNRRNPKIKSENNR